MVKLMIKWLQVLVLGTGLLVAMVSTADDDVDQLTAVETGTDQAQYDDEVMTERPGYGAIVVDAAIARPLGIVGTALGAAVWVVTLPFTLPTGTVGEAGQSLVVDPAVTTFYRCLGCFESGWRKLPPADAQ